MKARGGKSARTSPDKNPGPAASVAKLAIDPAGGRGELRALGGGKHDEWNQGLTAHPPTRKFSCNHTSRSYRM